MESPIPLPPVAEFLEAVQDDRYCRNLSISLYAETNPWNPPKGTQAVVRFRKADGTGGEYDTLPDGERAYAVSENVLTVALAPQVTTVPGIVELEICLYHGDAELNCFPVRLNVQENMKGLLTGSEDYYNVCDFVPRTGWEPNMYLGTDESGAVVTRSAPESGGASGSGSVSEEKIAEAVAEYMAANPPSMPSEEEIADAVEDYLTENPPQGGATQAQLAQIEQNRKDIAALPVVLAPDGYTDLTGIRQLTGLSMTRNGEYITVTTTLEGAQTCVSVVHLDVFGRPAAIVTDGVECAISWEGFDAVSV